MPLLHKTKGVSLQIARLHGLSVVILGTLGGSSEEIADLAIEFVVEVAAYVHAVELLFDRRLHD